MKAIHGLFVILAVVALMGCSADDRPAAPVAAQKTASSSETSSTPTPRPGEWKKHYAPGEKLPPDLAELMAKKPNAAPVDREPVLPPVVDLPDTPGRRDAVALFSDGKRAAACGEDGVVQVFTVGTKTPVMSFKGVAGEPRLAVSPDGKWIAQGSQTDTHIHLWSVEQKGEAGTLETQGHPVADLAFSPDSSRLAAASSSTDFQGDVQIWKLAEKSSPTTLKTGSVTSIDYSPDGKHLATAGNLAPVKNQPSSVVRIWDLATGTATKTVDNQYGPTYRVAFSPDGSTLAIAERNGPHPMQCADRIRLVDPRSGAERGILRGHGGEINGLSFTRDGRLLVSAGQDSMLRVWQVPTLSLRSVQDVGGCGYSKITFSTDGNHFAIAAGRGAKEVHGTVWPIEYAVRGEGPKVTGIAPLRLRVLTAKTGRQIAALAFSKDGQRLASSTISGETHVYELASWARLEGIEESNVFASGFSADLEQAVVRGDTLQIRELRPGGAVREVGDRVKQAYSYSEPLPGGKNMTVSGTTQLLQSMTVSPDGRRLATSNSEGLGISTSILNLRNWESSELVASSVQPEGSSHACAISFDGSRLVTGGKREYSTQYVNHDGPVSVYDLRRFAKQEDWQRTSLKRKVQREISDAEKAAFARAAKIYEAHGTLQELQSELKSVAAELDEIKTSLDPLDIHWQLPQLNESGCKFDALKFRIPDGSPLDVMWRITLSPWIQDGGIFPVGNDKNFQESELLSLTEWMNGADFRQMVGRVLSGAGITPGREFIVWFSLGNESSVEGSVAVNLVPRGFLATEGWVYPTTTANVPAMRRMHLFFHGDRVVDVAISADGSRVASAGEKGNVKIWDVESEKVLATFPGLLAEFSPDGDMLASAEIQDEKSVIVLRNARSGEELRRLRGDHFLGISKLVFSPDGKRLASGGRDGIVMVWNTSTGEPF